MLTPIYTSYDLTRTVLAQAVWTGEKGGRYKLRIFLDLLVKML